MRVLTLSPPAAAAVSTEHLVIEPNCSVRGNAHHTQEKVEVSSMAARSGQAGQDFAGDSLTGDEFQVR